VGGRRRQTRTEKDKRREGGKEREGRGGNEKEKNYDQINNNQINK